MRSPRKTTTLVVVGAAGLASAAYGLGTQIDGGSASAARDSAASAQGDWRDGPRDRAAGLAALAKELGVSAAQLRDAFADFHAEKRGDGREAFASALAEALGKQADEVQEALDSLHERKHTRFAARLAEALGVDAADVRAALEDLKDDERGEPGDFPADLAEKLGVEAADVEAALRELRPDDMRGGPRDGRHMSLRRLAAALDVTRAELRQAFREVHAGAEARFEDGHDELVEFLAERFNLSKEKVEGALPDFAGPGPGGPGGPGDRGPDGMGPGGPHGPGPGGPPGFGP